MKICPRCHGSDYNNKDFVMMVNECGHTLCRTCVDIVFARMSAACPKCGRMLKKNTFWVMQFDDPLVEVEVYFRKKIMKVYNLKEEDFSSLAEYNDYLESVEEIVFNFVHNQNVEETKAAVAAFSKENEERIQRNKSRLSKDEQWIQKMLKEEEDMHLRHRRLLSQEVKEMDDKAHALRADADAVISDLMHADAPAHLIVQNKRQQLENQDEDQKKKDNALSKKSRPRITMSQVPSSEGIPYIYKKMVLPDMALDFTDDDTIQEYCKHLASPSIRLTAGGFTKVTACKRVLQHCVCDLFFGC